MHYVLAEVKDNKHKKVTEGTQTALSILMNVKGQNLWGKLGKRLLNKGLSNAMRINQYVLDRQWELLVKAVSL